MFSDDQIFLTFLFDLTAVSGVFFFLISCAIEANRRKAQVQDPSQQTSDLQRPKVMRQMALPPSHRRIPLNIATDEEISEESEEEVYEYINALP